MPHCHNCHLEQEGQFCAQCGTELKALPPAGLRVEQKRGDTGVDRSVSQTVVLSPSGASSPEDGIPGWAWVLGALTLLLIVASIGLMMGLGGGGGPLAPEIIVKTVEVTREVRQEAVITQEVEKQVVVTHEVDVVVEVTSIASPSATPIPSPSATPIPLPSATPRPTPKATPTLWRLFATGLAIFDGILLLLCFLLLLFLLGLALWKRPRKTIRVQQVAGGEASVSVGSVRQRLAYNIDQLPDIIKVSPCITGRSRGVDVELVLETSPDVDVPMKTEEVLQVTREVIEDCMGLRLGKVEVKIKHGPYPKE